MRRIDVRFKSYYLPVGQKKSVKVEVEAEVSLGQYIGDHICEAVWGTVWDETKPFRFQMKPLDLNTVPKYQLTDWERMAVEIADRDQYRED